MLTDMRMNRRTDRGEIHQIKIALLACRRAVKIDKVIANVDLLTAVE